MSEIIQVEATVQTKPECDLQWDVYLTMGLILEIAFCLILNKMKAPKSCRENTVHIDVFLANSKHHVPIKLMSTAGNPKDFTLRGTLQKNQITITKHLILATFDIYWSSVMLKLGKATLVMTPLMDKYRVRSIMDNDDLIPYIMLLTGVIWQSPHKINAVAIEDINHSIQLCNFFSEWHLLMVSL